MLINYSGVNGNDFLIVWALSLLLSAEAEDEGTFPISSSLSWKSRWESHHSERKQVLLRDVTQKPCCISVQTFKYYLI